MKKKKIITKKDHAKECAQYILESEASDFITFCKENESPPKDGLEKIPHIYVDAVLALYRGKALKNKIADLQATFLDNF